MSKRMKQILCRHRPVQLLETKTIFFAFLLVLFAIFMPARAQACCYDQCIFGFTANPWTTCCTTEEECRAPEQSGCIVTEDHGVYTRDCGGGPWGISLCNVKSDIDCCSLNPSNSCCSGSYTDQCCGNEDDLCCGDSICCGDQCCAGDAGTAGDPVILVSATESFDRTDLVIGALYPITIERKYNSKSRYDSPLGYGWSLNYDKRLYTNPDGSLTVRKDCGGKNRYTWDVVNGYAAFVGNAPKIAQTTCAILNEPVTHWECSQTIIDAPRVMSENVVRNPDGSYTHANKNGNQDIYDEKGRLVKKIDAKGNSLVITYTAQARDALWGLLLTNLNQITPLIVEYDYKIYRIEERNHDGNPTGAAVSFQYDSNGRLTSITDGIRTITYGHDPFGNLTSVSGNGVNATYGYTNHRMTSIDEGQGVYSNTYDTKGRVTGQTHGSGQIDFEYLIPYRKTKVTTTIAGGANGPLTQVRTVEFDALGQVIKSTDTLDNVTNYTRDSYARVKREERWEKTGVTLVLKSATDYTYDAKGNMLSKTEAQGTAVEKNTTYTYDPVYSLVTTETVSSVVNPTLVSVVTNSYDDTNGNLLFREESGYLGDGTAYSYMTAYTYDANGKLTGIDGPRPGDADKIVYAYDLTTGFLLSMTQPIIGTTTYADHDSLGNPRTVIDPNGNSIIYTYDETGRVLTVKAPGDTNPAQYFYVSGGCSSCGGGGANKIDHITLPEGNTITYTYDSMGNIASIKDSLNNSINYSYDSEGNKLTEQIKDPGGALQKTLSYQYDALNRLTKIVNPDNSFTQYTYDALGNRQTAKDPKENTTTYNYDALSRLTSVIQPGTVTTTYGYNTNSNLTSIADANNNTTTYVYDDKGRVYRVISPDTGTTTYAYDPAGNLLTKTDAKGVTISYTYDALNRLTTIDYPADTDTVYSYDTCINGKGRLCSMADASGTTTYEYAPKGQVKKETKVIDTVQYVTQYTYDMNGNMKTMTYPSGKVITYNYTNDRAVGVLNGAANLASSITYKPFGGMNAITYGNGLSGTIGYDNQYRISSITAGAALSLSYAGYDSNGNITAITDSLDATKSKSFTYDNLDRLGTATSSGIWGSLAWTYDGVGNRQTENTNAYAYYLNTNKLNTANGLSFGYDNNGNTITEAARQYVYNQNQRLIQVNDGSMTANYTYNGNGQRVKKVVNGTTTIFHYSLSGQIIAESNSAGTIAAEYVYLNGQPLAKMEGANTYYYHNDHLGTPQKMTDSSGAVVWSADYKPFGEATVTVSTITNNLRFPGQYFDAETGLHYNYFRDYSPATGRYIEIDPLLLPIVYDRETYFAVSYFISTPNKLHNYLYAASNPLKFIDFLGLHHIISTPMPPNIHNLTGCALYNALYEQLRSRIVTLNHDLWHMQTDTYGYWVSGEAHASQMEEMELRLAAAEGNLNALIDGRRTMCGCQN